MKEEVDNLFHTDIHTIHEILKDSIPESQGITDIPNSPTGQAVIERSNQIIKDILNKEKGLENTHK